MALIGELDSAALAALTSRVKARIQESSVGMSAPADATAMEIAGAAVAFIVEVSPKAPEAIAREAAVRLAGWNLDNRSAVVRACAVQRHPSRVDYLPVNPGFGPPDCNMLPCQHVVMYVLQRSLERVEHVVARFLHPTDSRGRIDRQNGPSGWGVCVG